MAGLPVWLLVLIFAVAAGAVWVAGVTLSNKTDVLSARLGLGSALGERTRSDRRRLDRNGPPRSTSVSTRSFERWTARPISRSWVPTPS